MNTRAPTKQSYDNYIYEFIYSEFVQNIVGRHVASANNSCVCGTTTTTPNILGQFETYNARARFRVLVKECTHHCIYIRDDVPSVRKARFLVSHVFFFLLSSARVQKNWRDLMWSFADIIYYARTRLNRIYIYVYVLLWSCGTSARIYILFEPPMAA